MGLNNNNNISIFILQIIIRRKIPMKKEFARYCKLTVNNPTFTDASFDHEFGTQKEVEFEYDSAYLEYKVSDFINFILDNKLKVYEIGKLIEELRFCYVPYSYTEDRYTYTGEIEAEFREIDEYY